MSWPCFLLERTDRARVYLRRWHNWSESKCPSGHGYHDASVFVRDGASTEVSSAGQRQADAGDEFLGDPRWPTACACGYVFAGDDWWQLAVHPLWRAADGREFELQKAPAGAMWLAPWLRAMPNKPHPHLIVRLPDGFDWDVDGPSSNNNGAGWTRTGEPPFVTANPSIASAGYHGWLRDGVLTDDCEGRRFASS